MNYDNKKILFMCASGLGDIVKDLGIVHAIKSHYPTCQIDILAVRKGAEMLPKYCSSVHEVVYISPLEYTVTGYLKYFLTAFIPTLRFLSRRKYDCIVGVNLNVRRWAIAVFLPVKNKLLLKYYHFTFRDVFRIKKFLLRYRKHDIRKEYSILQTMGIEMNRQTNFFDRVNSLDLSIREHVRSALSSRKPNLLVNMFCAESPNSKRDWNRWNELIPILAQTYNIICIGIAKFDYKQIYRFDQPDVRDVVNNTNFEELIYLYTHCWAVITVDSLPFHLSYALGVPVVGLFGPVDPKYRIPPTIDHAQVLTIFKGVPCQPCSPDARFICPNTRNSVSQCMNNIQVADVLSELNRLNPRV